jgi:Iron-containing redox enzyme
MNFRTQVEKLYQRAIDEFTSCAEFKALESGNARKCDYDRFIVNVVRTHLRSPQLLAFLFSVAPPEAYKNLLRNMLEELGIDEEDGTSHPSLLHKLADGASLSPLMVDLEERAAEDIRQVVVDPLLYPSLREVGLAALVEIEAFEYMLSRVASRIARALITYRKLSPEAVNWFSHHSEVDIQHAEQGLGNLEDYIAYYELSADEAQTIAEITMRENMYIKRYFGEKALGSVVGRVEQ